MSVDPKFGKAALRTPAHDRHRPRLARTVPSLAEHAGELVPAPAEAALIRAWAEGVKYDGGPARPAVRAAIIRALMIGLRRDWPVAPGSLRLSNVLVTGSLDLARHKRRLGGDVPLPHLMAQACTFSDLLTVAHANLDGLSLKGCDIAGIEATGVNIAGPLDLAATHVTAVEEISVSLNGADIHGDLDLSAIGKRYFWSEGEFCLFGARIIGSIYAHGAKLDGGVRNALSCDGATVTGDVFMRDSSQSRFTSLGSIRLIGTVIGGDLSVDGALLQSNGRDALCAERMDIKGGVFIQPGADGPTTVTGPLNFRKAHIAVDCQIDHLAIDPGDEGVCIDLSGAKVDGALDLGPIRSADAKGRPVGLFDLSDAHVGRLIDIPDESWPIKGQLELDGFTYNSIDLSGRRGDRAGSLLGWLGLQYSTKPKANEFKPQPYEQLARTLRAMGHGSEADRVAVAKHERRRKCGAESLSSRVISRSMRLVANHGYSPAQAVFVTAVYWMIGVLVITVGLKFGLLEFFMTNPPPGPAEVDYVAPGLPGISAATDLVVSGTANGCPALVTPLYALDLIIPILDLGQESACRLETHGVVGGVVQTGRVVYQLFGAILTAITVTTLTGVLRKD